MYYLKPQKRERFEKEGEMPLVKYSPQWSIPTIITRIGENTIDVAVAGGRTITISKKLIRKIGKNVSPSLQNLNKIDISHEPAKFKIRPDWETEDSSRKRVRIEDATKKDK